jgi:hypothetical protein
MAKNKRLLLVGILVIATLAILLAAVMVVPVLLIVSSQDQSEQAQSETDSFKLHVNPVDPIIMSLETDEETIYMLGNKTSDGLPQSIDEFQIVNGEESTFVSMGSDGSVSSAVNTDGLQLDFIWGENFTTLHASLVLVNGSEQISINIDLSKSVDANFTDFENDINIRKRNVEEEESPIDHKGKEKNAKLKHSRTKRQSMNFVSVAISVESCEVPEPDARVFADVLLDYDEDTGRNSGSMRYTGVKTLEPGQYHVQIPTSDTSDVGDKAEMICDKIEMILGEICDTYSKVNKYVRLFSKHDADSVICFTLGTGLRLAFPALRLLPIHRFCKTAFRGLKTYCNRANADLGFGMTPAKLVCDALPLVDNVLNLFGQEKVLFTPFAVFPHGNTVATQGRVLRLSPGSSTVDEEFNIDNDQDQVRITHFSVFPFDPAPFQDYEVTVSYECYSSNVAVQMSIIGTDGYMNQVACSTGPHCALYVPGAEALVRDSVIVTIHDAPTTIERRVTIIF